MKRTAMILGALFSHSIANAQKVSEKHIPEKVKATFHKHFPKATEIKWEKEQENYEVGFNLEKSDYSALIDPSGNLLETEIEIDQTNLPANVKTYIAKNFKGQKIKEAAKITNSAGEETFEAEISGRDLIFDNKGNFIKESK